MIDIQDLYFAYPKKKALFKKLSLNAHAGSITGLLGTNGSGKTTFLKLLSGLLSCSKGEIKVNGKTPFDRDITFLEEIYFIPEEYFLPSISISEYIKAYSGFYPNFSINKFDSILEEFQLLRKDRLHELSHGQKKKFLVCFALATNCSTLLLDEPTNGLDIPSKVLFRKILAGSIEENQLVIISTHQVKDIENLIDNVVILQNGDVVFHENTSTISEQLYFGSGKDSDEESILYSEASLAGFKTISKQMNGSSSEIDIELLFNAIIEGKKLIKGHANK